MGKPYSEDLRPNVVHAIESGHSYEETAEDRPDVAAARKAWFKMQAKLDPRRLVFIDKSRHPQT